MLRLPLQARIVGYLLPCVFALLGATARAEPAAWTADLTVAADGSGDFRTIQAALDSIPKTNRERRVIFIRDGTYAEKIRIAAPFVTLRGESRERTRIEFAQGSNEYNANPDPIGRAVVNVEGDDCVLQNLTAVNTQGIIGVHAFTIYGTGDRTVITDANVWSHGNDTLSLWNGTRGRYYHARLNVRGSVDFICPRGWCYLVDSDIYEVNPGAEAALWHDGSKERAQKFVLRNCRLDGVEGWRFARHHRDAQIFLLDCTFSTAMRDKAPRRVVYPLKGEPTEADRKRNSDLDRTNQWGERFYFHNCHRAGGDYAWHADNLTTAEGAPTPEQITARWSFDGTWDPERATGPRIVRIASVDGAVEVTFSETVAVKSKPILRRRDGVTAEYDSGSGSDTLRFRFAPGAGPAPAAGADLARAVAALELRGGAIVANEATATLLPAELSLP